MTGNLITLLADLPLTLSFIAALIFGIAEVRAASRDRRKRFALETLRTFQTRDFAQLIQFVLSHNFQSSYEGFQARPAEDQTCLIEFAQEMESIGILVAEHYIDIDLLDKTLGVFIVNAWKKYEPMYSDMREKLPDPFLGEYFQWLAERIVIRMRDTPRLPFHNTIGKAATAAGFFAFSPNQSSFIRSGLAEGRLLKTLPAASLFQWLQ